jgi:hypothetical protein
MSLSFYHMNTYVFVVLFDTSERASSILAQFRISDDLGKI